MERGCKLNILILERDKEIGTKDCVNVKDLISVKKMRTVHLWHSDPLHFCLYSYLDEYVMVWHEVFHLNFVPY